MSPARRHDARTSAPEQQPAIRALRYRIDQARAEVQPAAAPAGWHPVEDGGVRWWDGQRWTDHYARHGGSTGNWPRCSIPVRDGRRSCPGETRGSVRRLLRGEG